MNPFARWFTLPIASAGFAAACALTAAPHQEAVVAAALPSVAQSYTSAQAERGSELYKANCAECHGANLDDGQFASSLKGPVFVALWGGKGLDEPFEFMSTQMPPTAPGSLGTQAYADVLAYLLNQNGIAPGDKELPIDAPSLKQIPAPH